LIHVAHRLNQVLDGLLLAGFGDQRAGDEGAEGDRVAELVRQEGDGEAETDARNEGGLWTAQSIDGTHRARHEEKAEATSPARKSASLPVVRATFGPMMKPARMYPSTTGCRRR
jgi:hypothetical protein